MSASVSASVTLVFVKNYFGYWSSVTLVYLLIPPGSFSFSFRPMTEFVASASILVGILNLFVFQKICDPEQQWET